MSRTPENMLRELDTECVSCWRKDDHFFCWRWLEWIRVHTGGWMA